MKTKNRIPEFRQSSKERFLSMKRTITLLLTLAGLSAIWAMAQARAVDKTPGFLQVKLGKTLAEQFPECRRYDAVNDAKSRRDRDGFRCYDKELGYIFDHDTPFYPGIVTTADEYEANYKTALAHTETDSDTKQVGYVGTNYSMDQFKETFAALKAKRGQPTSCTTTGVQNLMGARMKQIHCEWKQPWGIIATTAPSSDDLTLFDVWAATSHHIQLRRQEELANQKKANKDF